MLAKHARSGQGKISKASRAREGDITKAVTELDKPSPQPKVPSNIPGSGPQGVPPASADKMGEFARTGNATMIPKIVNAQTGLASQGPAIASSVARMGGQVRLAPGQFRAWAHPRDAKQLAKPSDQTKSPPPAKPVY
jgi:hypothetical protein